MDSRLRAADTARDGVRLSSSPGRSPRITAALRSPAHSVHPEMQGMEAINSQSDYGLRTDFFDDSSEDDLAADGGGGDALDVDLIGKKRSDASRKRRSAAASEAFVSQCESKMVSRTQTRESEGYQRLDVRGREQAKFADTPYSSAPGSVDELLPEERCDPPQMLRPARTLSGRQTPRSSLHTKFADADPPPLPFNKDQILAAHAIAHEITLQALMRDEATMEEVYSPLAPLENGHRPSLLPPALRAHDPRSPRNPSFQSPRSNASCKRVHVVPPPINTEHRGSVPADIVRTPYPFTPENTRHKDLPQSPQSRPSTSGLPPAESILTLSIRRSNPHAMRRVSSLTIPAPNDFSAVGSRSQNEKTTRFDSTDFDDAELFRQLRLSYRHLVGPWHYLSARSLRRIAVSGPASKAADAGYGWLSQPRSPRVLAYRGLDDTFSEEKILRSYRKPALGRKRYAFVHWAHRLAAAPPQTPQSDDESERQDGHQSLVRRREQPEGLEFVVSWSIRRIVATLMGVVVLSIAATLLWIFLGKNTSSGRVPHGGFRDAGDRVVTGVVMGICVLLLGLSGLAAWLGVSWLVI